jgi:hypothetical protein
MIFCAELLFITHIILITERYSNLPVLYVNCQKPLMEMAIKNFKIPYEILSEKNGVLEIKRNEKSR